VKKYFISNTPCGVDMYLPEMARLTSSVHSDRVCDLNHCHRFQKRRSLVERKSRLPFHDLVRNVGNCLLALVNRFDTKIFRSGSCRECSSFTSLPLPSCAMMSL